MVILSLFRFLRLESKESVRELVGARGHPRRGTRAFDPLKFGDHFIERFADDKLIDALGVPGAAADRLHFDDLVTIIGDDHLARADVLGAITESLFHYLTIVP